MTHQDYSHFCNFAHDLRSFVALHFGTICNEHLRHMHGLVQSEIAAAGGKVEPAYDFLAAMLAEEVASREQSAGENS